MDEAVRLALAKWPNVPSCTGWLRLSRRGEWRLPEGPIRHPGLNVCIGRNYLATDDGRWFFQNGPQQVFVDLDYTPVVLRLDPAGGLSTHSGLPATTLHGAWLDEEGSLLLESEHGIGLLDDRDLAQAGEALEGELDGPEEALRLRIGNVYLPVGRIRQADVPARFGFIPNPG